MYAYTESIKMKITHGVTEESYVFGQTELVILKHFSETRISHEMASKYMIKPLVGSIDVECELLSKEDVEKYIKSRDIEKASHGRIPNI